MELKVIEMLKNDLLKAIKEHNISKIEEITRILSIPEEQTKYFEKGLTGYPSIDKVWLDKYAPGAEDRANDIPLDKTVWDVIEEKLLEYYDIPALEYFKRLFSRQDFIDSCYKWARTFRAMGINEDEVVPVYGPVVSEIWAMFFGLNMIGACPYFLKLAISPEALAEETKDARIAIVYDGMWQNVAEEFTKDKYKKVIVATAAADMPSPKKEIVSFLSYINSKKQKSRIPDDDKYIWTDKALDISNYYIGDVKVPFKKDRNAAISSSSGTTINGIVKGTVATNESILSQLYSGTESEIPYNPGYRVLNHFPFTASTSMNSLFMLALLNGMTVVVDPRVSEKDFYNQLTTLKPNIALTTGSSWEAFFNRIAQEIESGKKFDFEFAKGWTIGGEGIDVQKYQKWNEIMRKCGAKGIYSGYGLSETFSAVSVEKVDARYDCSKIIMSVGLPQAGMICGIYDKDGKELSYDQRGELWVKTTASMKEYYNKPELTAQTLVDGWVRTGDIGSIDKNGFLYIWGREKDHIKLENETKIYLFDIANMLKEENCIDDAMAIPMPTETCKNSLAIHIVWNRELVDENNKAEYLRLINEKLRNNLPQEIQISAFAEHEVMLPYSPTTLKKDKNKMANQTTGFIQLIGENIENIEFEKKENGTFEIKLANKEKIRKRKKKKN